MQIAAIAAIAAILDWTVSHARDPYKYRYDALIYTIVVITTTSTTYRCGLYTPPEKRIELGGLGSRLLCLVEICSSFKEIDQCYMC